jgi:hypothetical protein
MPSFSRPPDLGAAGCLVKPVLMAFMCSDQAAELKVRAGKPVERAPDRWFHCSTHAVMPEDRLVAYLRQPAETPPASRDYPLSMSFAMGTIMGDVARQVLEKTGFAIVPSREPCDVCGQQRPKCREHAASQPELRSRGHLDSILNFTGLPTEGMPRTVAGMNEAGIMSLLHGYDHKTANPMTLRELPEMDEEAFKAKYPKYWWQFQEYMRLTGLRKYICLIQALGSPWTVKEYHIPFDPDAAADIERRYKGALVACGLA